MAVAGMALDHIGLSRHGHVTRGRGAAEKLSHRLGGEVEVPAEKPLMPGRPVWRDPGDRAAAAAEPELQGRRVGRVVPGIDAEVSGDAPAAGR